MNNNSRIELDITSSFKREGNILIINTVIKKSLFWHIMHGKTDLNIKDLCFYINSSVESICL
ncbi:hypothetical protein FACS1894166_09810 [Bacilli bacterium]|nr:hypothetical protein FACS1894166_09810 [Bacilli bacterium]